MTQKKTNDGVLSSQPSWRKIFIQQGTLQLCYKNMSSALLYIRIQLQSARSNIPPPTFLQNSHAFPPASFTMKWADHEALRNYSYVININIACTDQ
jgi:hypothetical protein